MVVEVDWLAVIVEPPRPDLEMRLPEQHLPLPHDDRAMVVMDEPDEVGLGVVIRDGDIERQGAGELADGDGDVFLGDADVLVEPSHRRIGPKD